MPSNLVSILAIITGIALIILMLIIYIRSRQGDRRVIYVANQSLLPVLSAITITVYIVFANRPATLLCRGPLALVGYGGLFATILLIAIGVFRFFNKRRRDIRLIMHPILFSVIIMTVVFLVEYFTGCL
ncbi:MAG TPA: hypothetical protein VKR06_35390 [Ktedonosporobacter sp.]|nr:hypothetical protein [Ktedonosporobacter sp.]